MPTPDRTPGPLHPTAIAAIHALADDAARHDGIAPLSEQPLLRLTDPASPVVHLTVDDATADDALLGYAQVDLAVPGTVSAELVVAPAARRRGIGTALLDAITREAEAHARDASAGRPPSSAAAHPAVQVWAHGDLPAARRLATRARMTVVRELWQMRLDLTVGTALAEPGLPVGVAVRTFVPGADEDAWCRVNARAFASHPEQGRLTPADVDAREREPWFDPAGFLLAERDGTLVGSAWTKVHPAGALGAEPVGELYALGIEPDAQGQGLGGALTSLALAHLRARGLRSAILYTEADNTAAVRTYRRAGFTRSAVDVMYGSPSTGAPAGDTMGG